MTEQQYREASVIRWAAIQIRIKQVANRFENALERLYTIPTPHAASFIEEELYEELRLLKEFIGQIITDDLLRGTKE